MRFYRCLKSSIVGIVAWSLALSTLNSYGQEATKINWVKVAEIARRAVVRIDTDKGTDKGIGSGFLVRPDGTLLTNYHVIEEARQISVKLDSGEIYSTRVYVLMTDVARDMAILRIEGVDLPFLQLGNSKNVNVGEEVIAIGTPKGLDQTVSNGIVSAVRLSEGIPKLQDGTYIIQTTAPISGGSSGGPLINNRGEVVGINSRKLIGGENLNFAIAINYARGMLEALTLKSAANPPERVLEQSDLSSQRDKSGGVYLTGYGSPGDSFSFFYLEIMNFLASNGVDLANEPSTFKPIQGDSGSLLYWLRFVEQSGLGGLLYLKTVGTAKDIDLRLQCFDQTGRLLWEEISSSLEELKRGLELRIGRPGLPLKLGLLTGLSNRWKSVNNGTVYLMQFNPDSIRMEAELSGEARQHGEAVSGTLTRQGGKYRGTLIDASTCGLGKQSNPKSVKKRTCSFRFGIELSVITPNKIEGLLEAPPPEAELDCAKCRWSRSLNLNPLTLIPQAK